MSPSRPTLADVAAAAGVSVSTASLAFSGAGPIAGATRQKVLDAAVRLDYSGPNPLGQQLRRGRSGIVGVVVGDSLGRSFRDPVSIQVLDGLVSTLGPLDLGVLLIPGSSDPAGPVVDPLVETAAMDVAVLMWGGTTDDPMLSALRRRGIPAVIVEGKSSEDVASVGIDDRGGIRQAAEHLLSLGHTRIATVTLPFNRLRNEGLVDEDRMTHLEWEITKRRMAGVTDAGVTPVAVYETPASLVEHGRSAGLALLTDADRRPTAVACQSDLLASGVVLAARELGLRVPQDVSVCGFDGLDLPWLAPDVLTTVAQPLAEKGAAIGHAVEDVLAGEPPTYRELPVELRIGTTTGPAPTPSDGPTA
ncbi:LacI family DNA-binding transcriptional regulator [Cellulomonas sp. URHD0024]|uniref:LacI family DNA-binding transcriptional regulator n=1 Tax=Cellulomonas sp. URHD0024 TaxID=1302620 RepID=UPI000483BB81|nr:LacI family DNA-binding transcriptional regulator [Cellulomonas sp. URHD0024]